MSRRLFSSSLLALAICASSFGQTTGNIEGRIADSSGAALPGAVVEATSPSQQRNRTSTSARDGSYRLPALSPGTYSVRASLPGFHTAEKTAVVSLDATASVDLTLDPVAQEAVVVSGLAPAIDYTSTTTGTSYTSDVIAHLPVGRNYADIVRSNPGVNTDRGDTQGRSLALSIYGATSAENQWVIDGVNTTNVFKGVQGKAINNEFIQEVEVKTGGYQAEYGRALGGIVNVITKSGGNTFHGDGFLYFDSIDMVARQKVTSEDSGVAEMRFADGRRYDSGLDLGGFLVRDRLWFFGAYDRIDFRGHVSRVESSAHVSKDDRFPFDTADDLYSGKLTWNPSASTSIVATVFADPSSSSGASGADPRQGLGRNYVSPVVSPDPSTWSSDRRLGGTDGGLRLTRLLSSSGLATAQVSYHRDRNTLLAADGIRYTDETCSGGTPESPCAFPPEPNSITGGYGIIGGVLDHSVSSRAQYRADVSLYRGDHEVKAGGDYMDGRTDGTTLVTGGQLVQIRNEFGQLYYRHQFFAKSPEDPTPIAAFPRRARVRDFGAYVQDSWKPSAGLTVNAGLRWDGEDTADYSGATVLRLRDQWQPRLGVVWDPWRDGKTKIYASAGRFSYALPTDAVVQSFGNVTQFNTFNFDSVGVTQDPEVIGHSNRQGGGGAYGDLVDAGLKATYQDEVLVGLERSLGPGFTVGVKGVYRRLSNVIEDRCDLDYSRPETNYSSCALINPGSSGPLASGNIPTCNAYWDSDTALQCFDTGPATPAARRFYRGIELVARKSVADRLWLQASYVYSSLKGNYDGGVNQGVYGQTAPGINQDFDYPQLWHDAYGRLALDRTHRFRLDGSWVTPMKLFVGLQFFAESGGPLNKLGYFNFYWDTPPIFLVPRGSAGTLPAQWEANLTLGYPIAVGPATVTLQAWVFNLFNNQIVTSRDEGWSIAPTADYPASIYDPNQPQTNPNYGRVTGRQAPRSVRGSLKVSF